MTARPKHDWRPDNVMGPIQVCNDCPTVWWQWNKQPEPIGCVPIEDVQFDYAAITGGAG